MIPENVYLVVSSKTGVCLSAYTTWDAAQADVNAVPDNRHVEAWVLKDGYHVTIGKYRP